MRSEKSIRNRIAKNSKLIKDFREDSTLNREDVRSAIFTLQEVNRNLKWVLKNKD